MVLYFDIVFSNVNLADKFKFDFSSILNKISLSSPSKDSLNNSVYLFNCRL